MSARRSRSPDAGADVELRLPRAPGVIRRFWARHPVFADVLIALLTLLLSLAPAGSFTSATSIGPDGGAAVSATPAPPLSSAIIVTATVLACAALLVRRRTPVLVTALATVATLTLLLAPFAVFGPLLMVAIYAVPVYRTTRTAWLGYSAVSAALVIVSTIAVVWAGRPLQIGLNLVVGGSITALLGVLLGINVGNRKRYLEAIIDRSRQLLIERDQQAQLAAAAERTRIAREMHDIVSHSLTVIVALAEGATATPDRERARAATAQAADTARGALVEMRAMLGVLRDGADDEAPLAPVSDDAVGVAVQGAQRAGFPVTLTSTGTLDDLPHAVHFAVARVVQESLTNAMRHAPAASTIGVRVDGGDPDDPARVVRVEILNDAAPSAGRPGGYGLRGLRERVTHVGGTLEAGPRTGGHWLVTAIIPLPATR